MSLIWIVNILSVFFLCVFFAGIVIPQILLIAFRRRLFDEPDERKIHQCVVPRLGGMAFKPVVFFSFVLLLAVNVSTGHDELLKEIGAEALPLAYAFCAIIMLYLVGIADDLIGVRYRAKFFIQIVCGIMLVAGGVELSDLHGMLFIHSMPSWISIPLTVFVTVFIINAINLIDGIDGLASGLCSIAFLFYGMTFIWFHQYLYAMLAFATLGVLIPFYYYKEIYIETERIIIRNFKQKDAEGLLEYLSNPRVNCFAGDRLCSEEAAWAYMQYSPKDMLRYAVSLEKDDFIIGDVFALRENEDTYNVFGQADRGHKIFMGDTGSLTIGIMLCFLSMQVSHLSDASLSHHFNPFVMAFAPLLVPCCDGVRGYLQRVRNGETAFLPGKSHVHHKLLAIGMRQRTAMVTIVLSSTVLTFLNILFSAYINSSLLLCMDIALWTMANIHITRKIRRLAITRKDSPVISFVENRKNYNNNKQ